MEIELGKTYRDSVTKFTGICSGIAVYLRGATTALIEQQVSDDGKFPDAQWIVTTRLDLVD
jgi:hypothetical protein